MRVQAKNAATTPIPSQLSELAFDACIFPHLSRPTRGPKYKLVDHGVHTKFVRKLSLTYYTRN